MKQGTLSLVVPAFNERENLPELHRRITDVMREEKYAYEIIFINDGSTDGSLAVLKGLAEKDPNIKVLHFRTNAGQTAALRAGIDHASGAIIIPIDSDLENDPRDIPRLLSKLDEGYDVVSGWRKNRWQNKFLTRKLPSMLANTIISRITGVPLHDYGCTLKAYRRDVLDGVNLYGEMHRFIPAYASTQGARVTEIEVRYQPRRFGKSSYGISRTFRVLLDLLVIQFLDRYMDRPMHFFGGLGFLLLFLGVAIGAGAVLLRLFFDLHLVQTPLPTLSVLFLIMGVNMVMLGVLSEVLMRVYYETTDQKPYRVKEKINF